MPTDYENIRAENIREYGEGTRHLALISDRLYPDHTHFVYELLQNAEDVQAAKVSFELHENRLEVRHDGRPFDENDVRGICGIGVGTKEDDLTKIGKFGIGFKSVYSFTQTPTIHSGEHHFTVETYIRPFAAEARNPGSKWTTLFSFPFDQDHTDTRNIHGEILDRLRDLGQYSLLFLSNIDEVMWKDGMTDEKGTYIKEKQSLMEVPQARRVDMISQDSRDVEAESESHWLVFERTVTLPEGGDSVRVEIAFCIVEDKEGDIEKLAILRENSPLAVFFPTEKDTGLGFLMQGPYRTTPARDNIPTGDSWNVRLVEETAELVVESLRSIRDMGLLTVEILESMPLNPQDFPEESMFHPIYDRVRNAFEKEPLLPAADGSYISGNCARLARGGRLVSLVTNEQLNQLFQSPTGHLRWLSTDITERRQAIYEYLVGRSESYLGGVGWEPLSPNIEVRPATMIEHLTEEFLGQQTDEWLIKLYKYLLNQRNLWSDLRSVPLIRLEDGSQVFPFRKDGRPNAYLPGETRVGLTLVAKSIADSSDAKEFLEQAFKYSFPDLAAHVIDHILPKYREHIVPHEEHLEDVREIQDAYAQCSSERHQELVDNLKSAPWLNARNFSLDRVEYRSPKKCYVRSQELLAYFKDNPAGWFADESSVGDRLERSVTLSSPKVLHGTAYEWEVSKSSFWATKHVRLRSGYGWHERALSGFDPEVEIEGLQHALEHIDHEKATYIWNFLLPPLVDQIRGRIEKATHQNYDNAWTETVFSKLGCHLCKYAWIPTKGGEFVKPSELNLKDMHAELAIQNELIEALQITDRNAETEESQRQLYEVCRNLGSNENIIRVISDILSNTNELSDEFEQELTALVARHRSKGKRGPAFPQRSSGNSERRREKVAERLSEAPVKTYEKRERSVRVSQPSQDVGTYLRDNYTNEDGQMFCQMCCDEMPFKLRNSESYYFERVRVADDVAREDHVLYLALCPLCSAKYTCLLKKGSPEALTDFLTELRTRDEVDIPVDLGHEQATISFVETHLDDLRTALSAAVLQQATEEQ